LSITPLTTAKIAVVDPMPTANAIIASSAVGFALFQERNAGQTTDRMAGILVQVP